MILDERGQVRHKALDPVGAGAAGLAVAPEVEREDMRDLLEAGDQDRKLPPFREERVEKNERRAGGRALQEMKLDGPCIEVSLLHAPLSSLRLKDAPGRLLARPGSPDF